jgi:hypothetical protein
MASPQIDPRDAAVVLQFLTDRQFVRPHKPLSGVLADARQLANVCPSVADRAVRWLGLDATQSVGRLRRTQLMQLAQCISRLQRAVANDPARWQHA